MATPYTTKAQVQDYLQKTIASSLDARLTAYIDAMSTHIDKVIGVAVCASGNTTKLYDGNGSTEIVIDHVNAITGVTVDGVAVTPLQLPYNTNCKTQLRLAESGFARGNANVAVTGNHALFATLPANISWACTVLVAGIVNNLDNKTNGVKSEKVGEYSITYTDAGQREDYLMAMDIIKSYKPITF